MGRFNLERLEDRIAPSSIHAYHDCEPDVRVHQDNGWGNGDDDAPGGSEPHNGAENEGGNADNTSNSPGNSGSNGNPNR